MDQELVCLSLRGLLVLINVSRRRSDAHLAWRGQFQTVPLPDLNYEKLEQYANEWTLLLKQRMHDPDDAHAKALNVLRWLFEALAKPVLDVFHVLEATDSMHHHAISQKPNRVWWITGGFLSWFPLHATGLYKETDGVNTPTMVMDKVISSYAPTVQCLLHSLKRLEQIPPIQRNDLSKALVVCMPETNGESPLANAKTEAANVQQQFSLARITTQLLESPTRDHVLSSMSTASFVHFACHGRSDPNDPLRSSLLLQDCKTNPLDLKVITEQRLPKAQLAYLSACETSKVQARSFLNESLHIASAFQIAGFPHVVGTLWQLTDEVAEEAARTFYEGVFSVWESLDESGQGVEELVLDLNGQRVAAALHSTLQKLREVSGNIFDWAPLIHLGG